VVFDRINAASLAVQLTVLSHRTPFLSQKRRIANLDAIALEISRKKAECPAIKRDPEHQQYPKIA